MLPIIPIIIIAKLSTGIPARRGPLYENVLEDYLQIVENSPVQNLMDSTAGLLTAFHTVLVLLQASTGNFDQIGENNREYMEVASFPPSFVKKDAEGEITGGELKKCQTLIEDVPGNAPYKNLINNFDKDYPKKLLQCFEKLSTLPANFQIENCLSQCLGSVNVPHPECLKSAINLCHSILLSSNVKEARGWLDGQPDPITNTTQWLKAHLDINNTLGDQIAGVTNAETKRLLRKIQAMLSKSGLFHEEIIYRLDYVEFDHNGNKIENGNDIKEAIEKISANLSPDAKLHWKNLQSALFGTVSWHIVNQARYASGQISYLLKVSGI